MICKHFYASVGADEIIFIANCKVAESFIDRARGLLFTKELSKEAGLFITECKSIHSFFMCYVIDAVFVNKEMVITKIVRNIRPWRITFDTKATHVLELPAGRVDLLALCKGHQLFMRDTQ